MSDRGETVTTASEELERLADLRDRGILTLAEFDEQKTLVLHGGAVAPAAPPPPAAAPPAAPVAPSVAAPFPPPTAAAPAKRKGGAGVLVLILGSLVIALVVVLMWAAGLIRKPSPPTSDRAPPDNAAPANAAPANAAHPAAAFVAPTAITPAGPAPQAPPSDGAAVAANPLLGEWVGEGGGGSNCPNRVIFGPTRVAIGQPDGNGGEKIEFHPIAYVVQGPTTVSITQPGAATGTDQVQIQNGHIYLDGCDLHH